MPKENRKESMCHSDALREVVRDHALLHGQDELPVPVVPVDAWLAQRVVVQDSRALSCELVDALVGCVGALLLRARRRPPTSPPRTKLARPN